MLDTVVFGKIAGGEAAKLAKEVEAQTRTSLIASYKNNPKVFHDGIFKVKEPITFRNEIQELMKLNAGIIREQTRLEKGLKKILELRSKFYSRDNVLKEFSTDDKDVVLTMEVKSSLVVCEAIIRSALIRQESRGAHYRSDFPNLDDEKWRVNIYCRKEDRGMVLFKDKVKEIKEPLADLLDTHVKAEHHREFE